MKVVARQILFDFCQKHSNCSSQIGAWIAEVEEAVWKSPRDMKARYPNASILSGGRVVFNIKGNNYRLEVQINYVSQVVLIKRIGTHAEYSKWSL